MELAGKFFVNTPLHIIKFMGLEASPRVLKSDSPVLYASG
jgi:hypothetical protein